MDRPVVMAHPYFHAQSSVRRWGGTVDDYLPIHNWFDATKAVIPDIRHRALRHHAEGIFLAEQVFGVTITNSTGRPIPVRALGEQHVKEDLGHIPTAADWLRQLQPQPWMGGKAVDLGSSRRATVGVCDLRLADMPCEGRADEVPPTDDPAAWPREES